jgi:carbonic anhydrase
MPFLTINTTYCMAIRGAMQKKTEMNKLLILLFLLCLQACAHRTSKEISEAGSHLEPQIQGPQKYSLPSLDPGFHQSPINIFTNRTKKELNLDHFVVHFQDNVTAVENLGHTIQLDFNAGSTITVKDKTYSFKQMHFHTPSEHLIDGMTFPMELHIVSATENSVTPDYLVIAVLFKMGEENQFINEFIKLTPSHPHNKTVVKDNSVKLNDLLSLNPAGDLGHHYHYRGSLTTAPYTESVDWFVLKKVYEASPEQIETINKIEGNNARHIEPQNDRLVDDE